MSASFLILGLFTLGAGVGAVTLRNMVHCALSVAVAFVGIAMLFLHLGAQFVGLAQVLVYVGAIAILIVFAVLLTDCGRSPENAPLAGKTWWPGVLVAAGVLAAMVLAIQRSPSLARPPLIAPVLNVKSIGTELMTTYVLPLEVLGVLLTAAMIGAAVLAMHEPGDHR